MKKNIYLKNFIIFFIICIFLIFTLSGCSKENKNLLSKTEDEIEHLEEKIIAMMNTMNHITLSDSVLIEEKTENTNQDSKESQNTEQSASNSELQGGNSGSSSSSNNSASNEENTSKQDTKYEIKNNSILVKKDNPVDWEYVKSNAEAIHSTWATLTIDLHALNVNNEDILNFSNVLDQVTISANQEDKTATLNNLASLYAFFPNYITQVSDDNERISIDSTKACVLNSYALAEQDKWDEMKLQTSNAINYFSNILNGVNENSQNQNRISKIYVMLNELNNSIDLKDKDLYMIKYRNVMDELVNFKYSNEG